MYMRYDCECFDDVQILTHTHTHTHTHTQCAVTRLDNSPQSLQAPPPHTTKTKPNPDLMTMCQKMRKKTGKMMRGRWRVGERKKTTYVRRSPPPSLSQPPLWEELALLRHQARYFTVSATGSGWVDTLLGCT